MKSYVFKVGAEEDEHEDGRPAYQAHYPDIEEAETWGDTRDEALQRINELLQTLVELRVEKGFSVPNTVEFESPAVVVTV